MKFTVNEISKMLDGTVDGNPEITVNKLTKIQDGCKHGLSFLSNLKYKKHLYKTNASAVIVNNNIKLEKEVQVTLIKVDDSYAAFAKLLRIIKNLQNKEFEIEQPSFIHKNSNVDKNVYIGAFTYISKNTYIGKGVRIYPNCYIGENVKIDEYCTLYSGVKIYNDCKIEKNCTIHAGTIIGADGFGFAPNNEKSYDKIPQIGNVIIHEGVEIGANTCIDRATLGSTIIHKGVKLDNMIQIAHNVEIGENTVIASQTAIAGSTKIGNNCMIGGHVAIAGHLYISDNVKIAGKSGIAKSIDQKGKILQGNIAFNIKDFQRSYIYFRQLPSWNKRIKEIEKQLSLIK